MARSRMRQKNLLCCLAGLACMPAGAGGFSAVVKNTFRPVRVGGNPHPSPARMRASDRSDALLRGPFHEAKRDLRRPRYAMVMSQIVAKSVARTPMPPGYEGEKKERGDGDDGLADFNMNVGKVIETLRRDYPRIFYDALDFDIYTDDLQLIDPSGVVLSGVRPYQRLFAVLRFFRQVLLHDVSTSFRLSYDASRQQVRVCWHFVLDARAAMRPLHVDGVSVYSLNHRGLVRKHVVETIIVNGTPVKPPFAQAWINLPSWLAEGLKGGARAPGLTSSISFASILLDASAIRRYAGLEAMIGDNYAAAGENAVASALFPFHNGADDSAIALRSTGVQYLPLQSSFSVMQHAATPRMREMDSAVRRATSSEGMGGGTQEGAGDDSVSGQDNGSSDTKSKDNGEPKDKKDAKKKNNKKKKKSLWPMVDSPWSCETSWDCQGGQVCCDLILVKVCCSNGIMQPKPGDLIPVYIPIPGRGRTELDQIGAPLDAR